MKATLIKSENSYILKDGLNHVLGIDDKKLKDRLECPYLLSKQNCDEIFGIYSPSDLSKVLVEGERGAFEFGYCLSREHNKDKVFTLEDIKKVIKLSREKDEYKFDGKDCEYKFQDKEIIQSLQQPTEIEVEIEMEDSIGISDKYTPDNNPKLDSQGCLILTKKI